MTKAVTTAFNWYIISCSPEPDKKSAENLRTGSQAGQFFPGLVEKLSENYVSNALKFANL